MCVFVYVCVCVCVCMHIHACVYTYVCVCGGSEKDLVGTCDFTCIVLEKQIRCRACHPELGHLTL